MSDTFSLGSGTSAYVSVQCPAGKRAMSGGPAFPGWVWTQGTAPCAIVAASMPNPSTTWVVYWIVYDMASCSSSTTRTWALCCP
jgi:hypothetical protein